MGSPAQAFVILHEVAESREPPASLMPWIAEDAVFHSPVMHTPQEGRELVAQYLMAALQLFSQHGFRYVRRIVDGGEAAFEFTAEIDGIEINGVDLVSLNSDGKISDFKVMVRPYKAIEIVRAKMLAQLEAAKGDR
ncbi:nuclear transport factor 2 family protein [Aurantiacibacter hainanensis]|uniref:nuclear transport factor 2 family protein n=1 Tax=Aurantiacibacter hainanensis TaxID=3076114 RepID=UPI0030C66392